MKTMKPHPRMIKLRRTRNSNTRPAQEADIKAILADASPAAVQNRAKDNLQYVLKFAQHTSGDTEQSALAREASTHARLAMHAAACSDLWRAVDQAFLAGFEYRSAIAQPWEARAYAGHKPKSGFTNDTKRKVEIVSHAIEAYRAQRPAPTSRLDYVCEACSKAGVTGFKSKGAFRNFLSKHAISMKSRKVVTTRV